ncbi:MAG: response regulator [Chitinivibrionales bacterium]|nr:response regulator [Chitinivibrionales bacterium]
MSEQPLFQKFIESPDTEHRYAVVRPVAWLLIGSGFTYGLFITILWLMGKVPLMAGLIGIGVQLLCAISFLFCFRNKISTASYLIVLSLYLAMYGGNCYFGISHSMLVGYAMVAILAGILIDTLAALFFGLVSIGTYLLVTLARTMGTVPQVSFAKASLVPESTVIIVGLSGIGIVLWLYNRQITRLSKRDREMGRELAHTNTLLKRELEEKRKVEQAMSTRLQLEKAVSTVSSRFIGASTDLDIAVRATLQDIANLSNANRTYLVLLGSNSGTIEKYFEEYADGQGAPQKEDFYSIVDILSFAVRQLKRGECLFFTDIAAIPDISQAELKKIKKPKLKSILLLPLFIQQELAGFIGCDNAGSSSHWHEDDIAVYRIISQIIANALLRKNLEDQFFHSQKMEAVGRLAGGIAHDFNNILTAIMGYSELLAKNIGPDKTLQDEVEEIKKAGNRAATLIYQLLAFSRKQVVNPQQLDLNELLRSMENMLGRLLSDDIRVETKLIPDLMPIKADPVQLEQILMNLAVNARDAMTQGGTLRLSTRNVVISPEKVKKGSDITPGDYVLLSISDTGVGMSDYVKSHLFEPFFTTKKVGKGTGLGLATVYGIVKQHNGHIIVESKPDHGTMFRIYLPQHRREVNHKEIAAEKMENLSGDETILIVEDNEPVKNLICSSFTKLNYKILSASTPKEAIEVCNTFDGSPDLIITDVVMPGMSGHELVQAIAGKYPEMKVLFISGYTSSDTVAIQRGVMTPGTYFLQKPFTPDVLLKKVRGILDK